MNPFWQPWEAAWHPQCAA